MNIQKFFRFSPESSVFLLLKQSFSKLCKFYSCEKIQAFFRYYIYKNKGILLLNYLHFFAIISHMTKAEEGFKLSDVSIAANERVDDLQLGGLSIIQNPEWFCFGVDAVLLADFAKKSIKSKSTVLDLCTGNGIVPLLLAEKSLASHITGVEIQAPVAEMANRSVLMNDLTEKISIIQDDLNNSIEKFGKCSFDNITCNPPYKEATGGLKNSADTVTIARHEVFCTLEDIIRVSSQLLKPYGKLTMIHRPERLVEIICLMREARIEPKRLRFVHPSPNKTANMILIEGAKYGNPKLFLEPPLYVYGNDGNYSAEIDEIYGRIE